MALVLIESNKFGDKKIYIQLIVQGKKISKNLYFKKQKLPTNEMNEKIVTLVKKELINIIKSKYLIDVRTPFFLNAKFSLNKKSNLVKLNSQIKKIDSIENVYVQEFNKDYMKLKIKYLGSLDKIIDQLSKENIELKLINDQWVIKSI